MYLDISIYKYSALLLCSTLHWLQLYYSPIPCCCAPCIIAFIISLIKNCLFTYMGILILQDKYNSEVLLSSHHYQHRQLFLNQVCMANLGKWKKKKKPAALGTLLHFRYRASLKQLKCKACCNACISHGSAVIKFCYSFGWCMSILKGVYSYFFLMNPLKQVHRLH